MSATLAQIIVTEFNNDEEIKQLRSWKTGNGIMIPLIEYLLIVHSTLT